MNVDLPETFAAFSNLPTVEYFLDKEGRPKFCLNTVNQKLESFARIL